jgi:hypothetical protein
MLMIEDDLRGGQTRIKATEAQRRLGDSKSQGYKMPHTGQRLYECEKAKGLGCFVSKKAYQKFYAETEGRSAGGDKICNHGMGQPQATVRLSQLLVQQA